MIVDIIIPFVVAALSGMGVGGGGLFVIFLSIFTSTPQLAAQGMNLLFFLFSASASVLVHLTKRRIYPLIVLVLALSGIAGSLGGTLLSGVIHPNMLRKIFGVMLVITGIFSLKERKE